MATNVIMPALELAQETGKLLRWIKAPGDTVRKGEPIAEIETDKVTIELEAPASGVLSAVSAQEGDVIPVGHTIAQIAAPNEAASTLSPQGRGGRGGTVGGVQGGAGTPRVGRLGRGRRRGRRGVPRRPPHPQDRRPKESGTPPLPRGERGEGWDGVADHGGADDRVVDERAALLPGARGQHDAARG